ncbi:replication initiation protein RepM [Psychrobacter sp. TAE2020]|uniref:replication initiation protein RepM n=1 Tax=Psychrobacter sp. TAE2020 TaxID=2846762 RepID=UPI001C0F85EA|nr:replication initiation protein RepM [Psychrobacter sp. TAE2020]MBU5618078.1 replication initiation protein RepM [Psychrobacter sp. TAE2020]
MYKHREDEMSLVVKTNRLNTVIQSLSLAEIRLIQVGIIDSRDKNQGLSADKPLRIESSRYAEAFGVTRQTAYEVMLSAEKTLFERQFSFIDEYNDKVKTRWISQAKYIKGQGAIEIIFTPAVVNEITRIDGKEEFFTQYLLCQTAMLNSVYSVRLYELVTQWRAAKKTPMFDLEIFRGQLGLGVTDYKKMNDFKKRVLDLAVNEINDKTDLKISYEQVKEGKKIVGFKFKVLAKDKPKKAKQEGDRDINTADMFTVEGLNDKQLGRIVRNPAFMAEYNHLVSPTSPAGQSQQGWEFEMLNRIKKDASQFSKRPIRDYLEY